MARTDNDFGPSLPGFFDFTILFEQSILSLLPASIFILVAPLRTWTLVRRDTIVRSRNLFLAKQVRTVESRQVITDVKRWFPTKHALGHHRRLFLPSTCPRRPVVVAIHTQNKDVHRRSSHWRRGSRCHFRAIMGRALQVG